MVATSQAAQTTAAGETLEWRPHDFRRIFVTDALRSGLPPHIAAKICGHALLDTTMGYAAIYPEDGIAHHRAFIARRRTEQPSEEYRELTATEWDEFLAHFELRKPRLEEIHANLSDRLREAREQGWLGEVAAIETTLAAAAKKLQAMHELTNRSASTSIHIGMPDVRPTAGRSSPGS